MIRQGGTEIGPRGYATKHITEKLSTPGTTKRREYKGAGGDFSPRKEGAVQEALIGGEVTAGDGALDRDDGAPLWLLQRRRSIIWGKRRTNEGCEGEEGFVERSRNYSGRACGESEGGVYSSPNMHTYRRGFEGVISLTGGFRVLKIDF